MSVHQLQLDPASPRDAPVAVEVVRSGARRRSSSAGVRGGRVVVRVPSHLTDEVREEVVGRLLGQLRDRALRPLPAVPFPDVVPARPTRSPRVDRGDPGLVARADAVADRHLDGLRAHRVAWSHRMETRWASCTVARRHIRVSARLADAPDEVLDDVLLHELAHILEPGHGPRFHALAARGPHHHAVERWLARRSQLELRAALGLAASGP